MSDRENKTLRQKILMIAPGYSIHAQRPLHWLLNHGFEVLLLSAKNPFLAGKEHYQFQYFPYPAYTRYYQWLGHRFNSKINRFRIVRKLKQIANHFKPDITHVFFIEEKAYYCAKADLSPLVLTAFGSDVNDLFMEDAKPDLKRKVQYALSHADLIMVDAPDMIEKCRILACDAPQIELLTLGIDTQKYAPDYIKQAALLREQFMIPDDAYIFYSARAWNPHYQHHLILEAFADALKSCDRLFLAFKIYNPIMDTVTGRDEYELMMRQKIKGMHLENRIIWLNDIPYDRLPEIYAFSDCVVNYLLYDAFPVTFLEAAACEKPVISCRLPAYEKTFAETYFHIIPPQDKVALTQAMIDMSEGSQYQSADNLKQAREYIVNYYDEKIIVGQLFKYYHSLTEEKAVEL